MIHRLFRGQPRDWRQHAEGVGGQHDNVPRMIAGAGGAGVGDEIDGIAGPRVFGVAVIIQVQTPRHRVDHDIFQHRAETAGGGVDFRLGFG